MKVRHLMSKKMITVEPQHDLGVALALMYEFDIRRLPVLESETNKLLGIISDRDVRLAIQTPLLGGSEEQALEKLDSLLIADLMTTNLIVIEPDASIGDAARRMLSHKVNGLPVVELDEDGELLLIGIITTSDLLRYLAKEKKSHTPKTALTP